MTKPITTETPVNRIERLTLTSPERLKKIVLAVILSPVIVAVAAVALVCLIGYYFIEGLGKTIEIVAQISTIAANATAKAVARLFHPVPVTARVTTVDV